MKRALITALLVLACAGCASNDKPSPQVFSREQSMIVDNPAVYQDLFQQLQRATFVRQGLQTDDSGS